nr:helix-turn-helix transcriptional regulator [Paracoccus saliphilus]
MGVILRELGQGRELTPAEINPMLSYTFEVTLGEVMKSIELLEKNELVVRERRGRNVIILPTERGYDWTTPTKPPSPDGQRSARNPASAIWRQFLAAPQDEQAGQHDQPRTRHHAKGQRLAEEHDA